MDLVDPNLHLHGDELVAMQQTINVALLCLSIQAERRPTMGHVVAFLQGDQSDLEVVIRDIGVGTLNKSYENLIYGAHSSLATGSEALPLFSGSPSIIVSSNSNANPIIANIELSESRK